MRRPLLVLLLPLAALGGCRVDATIEARVTGTGGEVTARFALDREAVAVLGGTVGEGGQTSDLERAGWEISPVRRTPDGGAVVETRKGFGRPADLAAVVGELAGPGGPLHDFRLDRRRTFTKETYRLRGTADLGYGTVGGGSVTGWANAPDLPARLRDAGIDPDRVGRLLAERALDGFHLRLAVDLPGREEVTYEVLPGTPTTVDLTSRITDRRRPALLALALVSGLIVVFRLRRRTSQT